jgi:acetyl-CoA carboxylase carboxyltransferase component
MSFSRTTFAHFAISAWIKAANSAGVLPIASAPSFAMRVIGKEALGGSRIALGAAGTDDRVARDEHEAIATMRRFLGHMPQNVWQLPARGSRDDPRDRREQALFDIVPRNRCAPPLDDKENASCSHSAKEVHAIAQGWSRLVVAALNARTETRRSARTAPRPGG